MPVSAVDAVKRGLLNLRGNPALILLEVAQGVVVSIIGLAGAVPLVLALGMGFLRTVMEMAGAGVPDPGRSEDLERIFEGAIEQWPMLLAALAAAAAVWTVGFLVYCWMQAGVLGVLAAGEERARGVATPTWRDFRAYSWAEFTRLANRRIWPYFWLLNLYLILGLVAILVLVLALAAAASLAGSGGWAIVFAVGCLVLVVALGIWLVLWAMTQLGKAELAFRGGEVWASFRRSAVLLWRRLGAVTLLVLIVFAASFALGVVFLPVSLAFDLAMGDAFARQLTADAFLMVLQSAVGAAVTVAFSAAAVALVGGEQ